LADTSDLNALVTRNIGDIEAAYTHAVELGASLMEDIADILRAELGDSWHVVVDVDNENVPLWFARRDWLGNDSRSDRDRYSFNFNMKAGPGDEYDHTWLASLMNTGPEGASVAVYFWASTFNGKRRWIRLLEEQKGLVENLVKVGFKQDTDRWLYLPFALDSALLAKGYEAGDITAALKPARDLASVICGTIKQLETLVVRDRVFE